MSKLVDFPSSLPSIPIPQHISAAEVVVSFASRLEHLDAHDFKDDAVWRDIFALTGTLRTFYTAPSISAAWKETTKRAVVKSLTMHEKSAHTIRTPSGPSWIQARFSFKSGAVPQTTCTGLVTFVLESDGKWRIWTLRTILEQLEGQPNVDVLSSTNGTAKLINDYGETTHFDCIIIGGGQAGLSEAGRLKALGISYVVLDKYQEVGDNWKQRYSSARLHTSREYSHLPFERTFTPKYQEWLSKDDLAEGYREWASKFDINIWTRTIIISGSWDPARNMWILRIRQEGGGQRSITSSFVVVAGGAGGQVPTMPEYPNRENFKGLILHSAEYKDSLQWKGMKGVVIGTANTGHDVAEDMVKAGLSSVTMIQRGSTYVLPVEHYKKSADINYNATTPTEIGDRDAQTQPFVIVDMLSQCALHKMADSERSRFDSLEAAGFKLNRYGSITHHLYNRMGGHYMDVGASDKISRGLIKIKTATPTSYTPTGLLFDDGTHLDADVIVFATGFKGNMRYLVEEIFGSEIAAQMGDFWTLDREGELKGAFKSCGHPAMWYHGGTLGQARYYSRFIALQIKAKLLGTPLHVYAETP